VHAQRARNERYLRRVDEVAQRVILDVVVKHCLGHERAGRAEQYRVSVGRGFRDHGGADPASRSGAVIDDHGLPQYFRHPGSDGPRVDVDISAGRERDDDADRLRWVVLAPGDSGREQRHYAHRERQEPHAVLLEYRFWKRGPNVSPITRTVKRRWAG